MNRAVDTVPSDSGNADENPAVLELADITAGYGRVEVLHGISLAVPRGGVVALLGPNGAGKTTLLRVASGVLRSTEGRITLSGRDVTGWKSHERAKGGVCLIPEGRGVFRSLTVRANLELSVPPWGRRSGIERPLAAFPVLEKRLGQVAGTLSGGEQQMLALSRAYLAEPRIVLLDEVSMGLAPIIVDQIFESIRTLAREGAALVLVEQYVARALEMADAVCLMSRGHITYQGRPDQVDEKALASAYMGGEPAL